MSRYTRRRREITISWSGDPRPRYVIGTEHRSRSAYAKDRRNRYILCEIHKRGMSKRPTIRRYQGEALLHKGGK